MTQMALNYFAFALWNFYFIVCVYSYYIKFKNESQRRHDEVEAQTLNV